MFHLAFSASELPKSHFLSPHLLPPASRQAGEGASAILLRWALLFNFILEVNLDTYYIFKIFHLTGIFLLFSALGGHMFRAAIGRKEDIPLPKFIGMFHKAGLILVLLAGIGLLANIGEIDTFGWIIGKFFILMMLAIWPLYLQGPKERLPWLGGAAVMLGLVAAFFALYKPF